MRKYLKKYDLKSGLILLHIFFSILGFCLYILNYQLSQTLLIQKSLNKQIILAKAGSLSVETLLKNVENQLSSYTFSFAKINENSPIDIATTKTEFLAYMQRSQLPITGIALFDQYGKLSIIENRYDIHFGEGQDFSHAEFIKWAQIFSNREKILISGPYRATVGRSVGKLILVVTRPIYFGYRYKGALVIRILIDDLRSTYISPLSSDAEENSFIVNTQGLVIAGRSSLLNKNLFIYAQTKKWTQYKDFLQQFATGLKGNTTQAAWTFQNPNEQPKALLVGISKIDLPNTNNDFYMVVTISQDAVLAALRPVQGYGFVWLGFGLLVTIISSCVVLLLKNKKTD